MPEQQTGESRVIGSVEEFLEVASLKNVEFYEVSAKSNEVDAEDMRAEASPQFDLRLQRREDLFRVRLRVSVAASYGEVAVDAAAVYQVDDSIEIPSAVGLEFAKRVGVMTVIPYLREAVHNVTSKVFGEGLVMPIMKTGDLAFNHEERISPPVSQS